MEPDSDEDISVGSDPSTGWSPLHSPEAIAALVRPMTARTLFATHHDIPEYRQLVEQEIRQRRLVLSVCGFAGDGNRMPANTWTVRFENALNNLHNVYWSACGRTAAPVEWLPPGGVRRELRLNARFQDGWSKNMVLDVEELCKFKGGINCPSRDECPFDRYVRHVILKQCHHLSIGELLRVIRYQLDRLEVYGGDERFNAILVNFVQRRAPPQLVIVSEVGIDLRRVKGGLRRVRDYFKLRGPHHFYRELRVMESLVHMDVELTGEDLDAWLAAVGQRSNLRRLDLIVHDVRFTTVASVHWLKLRCLREVRMRSTRGPPGCVEHGLDRLLSVALGQMRLAALHLSSLVNAQSVPQAPELTMLKSFVDLEAVQHLSLELDASDPHICWLANLKDLLSLHVHFCNWRAARPEAERNLRELLSGLCRANRVRRIRMVGVEWMMLGDELCAEFEGYTELRRLEMVPGDHMMALPPKLVRYGFTFDTMHAVHRHHYGMKV